MDLIFLAVLALLVRIPFLLQAGNYIDFDEATFALMAKRILQGELPIYISGHSYSGSLVSLVMAPFIALFGTTAFAVQLTPLVFFLLFFVVNFITLKKIAGQSVAIFSSLFLIVMPQGVFDVSMRVWGGHVELWVFAVATLFFLAEYFDGPQHFFSGKLLFVTGLIIGAALWISELFTLFLIPYLIYFVLRFRQPQEQSFFRWLINFFTLRYFKMAGWLRKILITLNCCLVGILLIHFASIFLLHSHIIPEKLFKIFGANPPFQIKTMKQLLMIATVEIVSVYAISATPFSRLLMIGNLGPAFGGFVCGYLPAIIFNLAGGKGLRIFHKSGSLGFNEILDRGHLIFLQKIPQFILGLAGPYTLSYDRILAFGFYVFSALLIITLVSTTVYFWRDLKALFTPKNGITPSYIWAFYFIGIFTIIGNLMSTLEAARYLAPLYLALAVILGYFWGQIVWKKWKIVAILFTLTVLAYFSYSDYTLYQSIPKERSLWYSQIIDYLKSENIQGGLACRNLSHILTFLSGEKIIFTTYIQPPERYLPHQKYTQTLHRKAYIFEEHDSENTDFHNDAKLLSKVKAEKKFGTILVYIVEDPSAIADQPYTPKHHRLPLHFYFNK